MAYRKLIACCLALLMICTNAMAGFSSMRPPPGYSKSGQMPGWGPSYKPAPGEFYDLGKQQWMTTASLNTGGRELTVPVALPIATAGSVGLAVATAFSSNPAILLGTAAWALYQAYLSQKRITPKTDGTFEQVVDGIECLSNCVEYASLEYHSSLGYFRSNLALANAILATFATPGRSWSIETLTTSYVIFRWTSTVNTDTSTVERLFTTRPIPPYNTSTTKLIPPATVATEMQTLPMSKPLVDALPMPLPVKSPVINPSATGLPQVLRVPQGSPSPIALPVPNPNNIPQQWKTPVVDVIPSPTSDDPWRVETIPKDIIKDTSTPVPDPFNPVDPLAPPVVTPEPEPGTNEQAKQPGLCDEYPDILACAKPEFDTPPTPELETKPRELTYTPDQGWGSGGACPAPRHLPGANVDFEFTLVCDFMTGIKPVLLTVASLIAGMIIIGARGGAAE